MPEELNRVLVDHLSALLLCPTRSAVEQLKSEGIRGRVEWTGDLMADLVIKNIQKIKKRPAIRPYYVATIHRNTNTDEPARLASVLNMLGRLKHEVRFMVHPRTQKFLRRSPDLRKRLKLYPKLRLEKPVSYTHFVELMASSEGVITDSGGIQKEAFLLNIPCVTIRPSTEWGETVRSGRNVLCEPSPQAVSRAFVRIQSAMRRKAPRVFGEGKAAERTVRSIAACIAAGSRKGGRS
ncbi:MAG: UDP-N-acetylglucosamine 2-epimerase, partial [Candidatus Omnitrophica bacterium]|nr:UDP-N-acetylglucosamine 2-epimerase [Candidatus Omnitrophota bacterium]